MLGLLVGFLVGVQGISPETAPVSAQLRVEAAYQLADVLDAPSATSDERKTFVRALTRFLVSLPVPILAWSSYRNIHEYYDAVYVYFPEAPERVPLAQSGNRIYWARNISAAYSMGLLVNLSISAFRFIRASQVTEARVTDT